MSAVTTACLLPPERPAGAGVGPYPPRIDRTNVFPRTPLIQLPPECSDLEITVNHVTDLDSNQLLFRWVANNGIDGTLKLDDDTQSGEPGTVLSVSQNIFFRTAFDPRPGERLTGIISLFVTDASAWEKDEASDVSDRDDLSGIVVDPNGTVDDFTVVEMRWTFDFRPGLPLDQCEPDQ